MHLESQRSRSFNLKGILCTTTHGFFGVRRRPVLFNFIELLLGKGKTLKGSFSCRYSERHYKYPHSQQGPNSCKSVEDVLIKQQLKLGFE